MDTNDQFVGIPQCANQRFGPGRVLAPGTLGFQRLSKPGLAAKIPQPIGSTPRAEPSRSSCALFALIGSAPSHDHQRHFGNRFCSVWDGMVSRHCDI